MENSSLGPYNFWTVKKKNALKRKPETRQNNESRRVRVSKNARAAILLDFFYFQNEAYRR